MQTIKMLSTIPLSIKIESLILIQTIKLSKLKFAKSIKNVLSRSAGFVGTFK
jgi:hypothetical protein